MIGDMNVQNPQLKFGHICTGNTIWRLVLCSWCNHKRPF